jgi:hypothetical protein
MMEPENRRGKGDCDLIKKVKEKGKSMRINRRREATAHGNARSEADEVSL